MAAKSRLPEEVFAGEGVDLFGVEHEVVALEEPRDAGAVQAELERADGEPAERAPAVPILTPIEGFDTLDPGRRGGARIGQQFEVGEGAPHRLREEPDPGGAGRDRDVAAGEGIREAEEASSAAATGSQGTSNRSATLAAAASARSRERELRRTAAPALPSSPATRWPTGPVPASTAARRPARGASSASSPRPAVMRATAAAAVVFAPLLSSMTDTRNPPWKRRLTAASNASPAARSPPPRKRAEFFLCAGPRV